MKIQIIKCLQDNYSYLIIDETSLNACVVDPSESKPIIDFVESNNINLKYILNTHHHFDHVGGNIELKKKYNLNVIGFMCIPPADIDPTGHFKEMNKINKVNNFEELSMGMSSDYLKAAQFNSTYLRIGSNIFGQRY